MSRRQVCRAGHRVLLALALLMLTVTMWPGATPARAAADAKMTFTGALDVAGVLSSVSVQPSAVTIPAGGTVKFLNRTSATLIVTVGDQPSQIAPDDAAKVLFTGAARAETVPVAATAVDVPLVDSVISAGGQIAVEAVPGAAPRAAASADTGASSDEGDPVAPASSQDADAKPGAAGTPSDRAVIPLGRGASRTATASPAGTSTAASDRGDRSGDTDRSDGQPDTAVARYRQARRRADAAVAPVLPPFPGFSSTHDQLGLVVLLSVVVLAGLGTALLRIGWAYRPLMAVGAHSQAARKARALRRLRR